MLVLIHFLPLQNFTIKKTSKAFAKNFTEHFSFKAAVTSDNA